MQEVFGGKNELINKFKASLSAPRFTGYLSAAKNDEIEAIKLYQWNARLSQALYIYTQGWEVCLRNKINDFLTWKYNENWPYDDLRAVRNLKGQDRRKLQEALVRQEADRGKPAPVSAIVADLSAGFWVAQLSAPYDAHYAWRHNLKRVFPENAGMSRTEAWGDCSDSLGLRNRIAHHEPVFHLPLAERHEQLRKIVASMCPATFAYCEATCNFSDVWENGPGRPLPQISN